MQATIDTRLDSTVVELEGETVAFANLFRLPAEEGCAIGNVVVSPAVRGRGVGRYLIERMIDIATSRHHASEVKVSCFNQNIAALRLYPKLGFQPYAIEERWDRRGHRVALIHMRLARSATG